MEVSLFFHCLKLRLFNVLFFFTMRIINLLNKFFKIFKQEKIFIYEQNSYSQAGEDGILNFLFNDKKIFKINYLDIGANLPDLCNNTYYFYKKGSYGVCVEADKTLVEIIKNKRPLDIVVNAGVSPNSLTEKLADFYIFDNSGLNTFDKNEAEIRQKSGLNKIKEVVKVNLIDINHLIEDYFDTYPDFLSIDIEGLDLAVLKLLNFESYPIPVICVETCKFSENHIRPKDNDILEFLLSIGYEVYADTYINTIFVNKEWFYTK
jgi:FkbM family methyltransferase